MIYVNTILWLLWYCWWFVPLIIMLQECLRVLRIGLDPVILEGHHWGHLRLVPRWLLHHSLVHHWSQLWWLLIWHSTHVRMVHIHRVSIIIIVRWLVVDLWWHAHVATVPHGCHLLVIVHIWLILRIHLIVCRIFILFIVMYLRFVHIVWSYPRNFPFLLRISILWLISRRHHLLARWTLRFAHVLCPLLLLAVLRVLGRPLLP